MCIVVMAAIITMSIVLGAELGPKADPTTTTYTPRPEWYFFFLFELLRVIKPPALVPLATIGIPTICMILLFLLPFYDRGPERRPERRPIATTAGLFVIAAMGYLTYLGAVAGPPTQIDLPTPARIAALGPKAAAKYEKGKLVVGQSGCLACHKIGENGNGGPGPPLTEIGDRLPAAAIARTLVNPTAPMPSFANLQQTQPDKFNAMVAFLGQLKGDRSPPGAKGMGRAPGTLEEPQVRAMFDRIASFYDVMNSVMTAGLHHRWRRRAADLRRSARAAARSTWRPARATSRSSSAGVSGRSGEVVGSDFSEEMLDAARGARRPACASSGATRSTLPYDDGALRRRDRRLRRAQLLRPRPRARRDGACRAPRRPRRRARDHDAAAPAAFNVLSGVVRSHRAAHGTSHRRLRRLQLPARARCGASRRPRAWPPRWRAPGLRDIRWILTAGGIIAIHVGTKA